MLDLAIADDWSVDTVNRIIKYVGSGARYSVNELYSYLMDLFDNPEYMDDPVPMDARTPTDYLLTNQWFIKMDSFKYLYGGAISTSDWNADNNDYGIVMYEFDTTLSLTDSDIGSTVSGSTTGDFGKLVDYDNTNGRIWVRVYTAGTYASSSETISVGGNSIGTPTNVATGEWLWSNLYTLGSIKDDSIIYIYYGTYNFTDGYYPKGDEVKPDWLELSGTGHIDVLIAVKEAGSLIKNGYVTVFIRNYGDTQDWFEIDLSGGGRNAVPLSTSTDISNTTLASSVRDYSDIIIAQVNGKLNIINESGTFQEWEKVTGDTSGATGYVLKYDPDLHYLILGQVDGEFQDGETISGAISGATATVSGTLDVSVTTIDKDLNNGNGLRPYDIVINCGGRTLAEVYEYMKYITSSKYFNIDYVFYYDGTNYTDLTNAAKDYDTTDSNTIDDVLLPPQTTSGGDMLYVGSSDKFKRIIFYITTPGSYSDMNLVWEYWNGSSWSTLTVTDNTSGFTDGSIRTVEFTPPADWEQTEINGATAYWIRVRSSASGSPSITTAPKASRMWIDFSDTWYLIQNNGTTLYRVYGWYYKYAQNTYSPVKQAPFGQYLGGTFFGARGVWIENYASSDAKNFQLIDSYGVIQRPPNIVTVQVTSLIVNDTVGVFRTDGSGNIIKNRYQIAFTSVDYAFFYNADSDTYVDESTNINDSVIDDVLLPPQQTTTEGDTIYIGSDYKFGKVRFNISTAGNYSDITIVWEYWNGSSWSTLTVTDNTNGFTVSGTNEVSFTPPADWAKTNINGVTAYWIRARATFGASPSITTAPLGAQGWLWFNYSGSNVVGVSPNIHSDEPLSGVIRIVINGTEHRYTYDKFEADRFILSTGVTLSQDYTEGTYVYVPIIDTVASSTNVSNQLIYSSDIPVIVRVRQAGYKPFEVTSTITSVGLSVSAIRVADTVYTSG